MPRVLDHSSVTPPRRPARTLALPAIVAVLSVSALPLIMSACESGPPPNAPTLPSAPEREAVLGDAGAPRAATLPDAAHAAPMTLFVRESYAECEGEGRMRCLQVRETDHAEWTLLYGRIEGFTYEEGLRYELRVESVASAGPRADAPRRHLRLIEILSKAKP